MNVYKITYRDIRSNVQTCIIRAYDETQARAQFYSRFDGRLLVISLVSGIDDSE